jgi:hypothetical protein
MQKGRESQYCEFLEFLGRPMNFLGRPMNFLGRGCSWVVTHAYDLRHDDDDGARVARPPWRCGRRRGTRARAPRCVRYSMRAHVHRRYNVICQ